jgi:hypothetical protein
VPTSAESLVRLERRRLAAVVAADLHTLDAVHADDFILVTPSGGTWTKEQYHAGISSGTIRYRRFEPVSDIEVILGDELAVLRYRSEIDIHVEGQEPGPLSCWHLDCYRYDVTNERWQVRWSQATEILRRP